jgi:ABC-type transport system substrate-binding protein
MNRRAFLRRLGLASGVLLMTPLPARRARAGQADWSQFQLKAAEPNPKYGGTLRYGILSAPAHFDVHQSGTVSNMAAQGPMYDNLIRRDPRDGQTIIPDLAYKWDISPDGTVYTFYLRRGVKFHDGAEFTAEDVHATYSRIVWPPKGVSIPRTPLFAAVSEIRVVDPYTIEFRLSEPRPTNFMLGAFASGWNIIVRKKTLEEHDYNLRNVPNFPGTGPFRHVRRIDKEVWIMERNPDYWNKGLPYLDRLEVYHIPPWAPPCWPARWTTGAPSTRWPPGKSRPPRACDSRTSTRASSTPSGPTTPRNPSMTRGCAAPCTWRSTNTCWWMW